MSVKKLDGLKIILRDQINEGNFIHMSDIVGLENLKKQAIGFAKRIKESTKNDKDAPKGLIFEGVGGTGKTVFARALAAEAKINFLAISAASLKSIAGVMAKNKVVALFQEARKHRPCLLFMDEIDAVAKDRATTKINPEDDGIVQQLLVELDGIEKGANSGVFVVCATNLFSQLDPAFRRSGRFDTVFKFNLPGFNQRYRAIEASIKRLGIGVGKDIDVLAELSEGLSYADIDGFLKMALNEAKNESKPCTNIVLLDALCDLVYGQQVDDDAMDPKSANRFNYHLAGHTLAYLFSPGLFLFGKINNKKEYCAPRHKMRTVTDVVDTFVKLISIYLAREADASLLGYASGLYVENDINKIYDLVMHLFYSYNVLTRPSPTMIDGLMQRLHIELTDMGNKIFQKYHETFELILAEYVSSGVIIKSQLLEIFDNSNIDLVQLQKEMDACIDRLLVVSIKHVNAMTFGKLSSQPKQMVNGNQNQPTSTKTDTVKKANTGSRKKGFDVEVKDTKKQSFEDTIGTTQLKRRKVS